MGIRRSDAVKGEATRQTGDGSKKALERLCHVMGDEILVHLHHRDERLLRVGQFSFTANAEQLLVMNHRRNEVVNREWVHSRISVHHE